MSRLQEISRDFKAIWAVPYASTRNAVPRGQFTKGHTRTSKKYMHFHICWTAKYMDVQGLFYNEGIF